MPEPSAVDELLQELPTATHAKRQLIVGVGRLGPGLITGAADDDPSGIATYSQAGAQFGLNMLWPVLFTYPLMVAVQAISARVGRVTGQGLAFNLRQVFPGWAVVLLRVGAAFTVAVVTSPARADADDKLPPLAVAARETFDAFGVPAGVEPGTAILNKLQVAATIRGERLGLPGWSVHAQVFRFDGRSLSRHLGDIQTADNIEAVPVTRLFEAYLARMWSKGDHSAALRVGLIDLNSQFDSVDPASLMLNSSHGIGPDLSRSGRNGPSIYPVTAAGSSVTWVKSKTWTFRLGVFDGVAGSPTHPRAFFAERLKPSDGLFVIGQADWQLTKSSRLEGGAWGYTAAQDGPAGRKAHDHGAYISYEAPLGDLPHLNFWLRAGIANGQAQAIAGYLGGGVVQQGTITSRPDDRLGLAIAHAVISNPAVNALGLHHAETSFEVTYQVKVSGRFVIQPDVQYIRHPAAVAHAPDSLGIGLRFVYASAYPIRMVASDPGDPTVPPDGAPSVSDDSSDQQ
jgi:porin